MCFKGRSNENRVGFACKQDDFDNKKLSQWFRGMLLNSHLFSGYIFLDHWYDIEPIFVRTYDSGRIHVLKSLTNITSGSILLGTSNLAPWLYSTAGKVLVGLLYVLSTALGLRLYKFYKATFFRYLSGYLSASSLLKAICGFQHYA